MLGALAASMRLGRKTAHHASAGELAAHKGMLGAVGFRGVRGAFGRARYAGFFESHGYGLGVSQLRHFFKSSLAVPLKILQEVQNQPGKVG